MEMDAHLTRPGAVYLAGEGVEVEVRVRCGSGEGERLAWCSVQLHCQRQLNFNKVALPAPDPDVQGTSATSFLPHKGEHGQSVFASKPIILFCDLELKPGQQRVFKHTEVLPAEDLPPSFRGFAVKYIYKMTVGVQRLNAPVRLIRIPFRVLVLSGLSLVCLDDQSTSPANPFLVNEVKASTLDIATQIIDNITGWLGEVYKVTTGQGLVCQLNVHRNSFKLGDDVLAILDFTAATVPCVQLCASLQTLEDIGEEYRGRAEQDAPVTTVAKHHIVTLSVLKAQICLPIPLTATPTFFTNIVHLKWRIHFEFVTTDEAKLGDEGLESGSTWEAPASLAIQTMVWDLPIKVFPSNPLFASLGSSLHKGDK